MSAAKEVQPLGSHSGKRGDIRVCVRCGKELQGVGRNAKYCPACRTQVERERALDYKARNPEKVRTYNERYYRRKKLVTWTPVYCQRCGCEIVNATTRRQKWCPDCRPIVEAEQHAANHKRKKFARSFAGPYMTHSRPADVSARASVKAQAGENRLRMLSNAADWLGVTYGKLMLKSPAEREALILAYKAAKGCVTHE